MTNCRKRITRNQLPLNCIANMDETAVWADMPGNSTIEVRGAHTVLIATTGHEHPGGTETKSVLLCCSKDFTLLVKWHLKVFHTSICTGLNRDVPYSSYPLLREVFVHPPIVTHSNHSILHIAYLLGNPFAFKHNKWLELCAIGKRG